MGAWIEIIRNSQWFYINRSHPTMGAWIEILSRLEIRTINRRRTPRWVRGLKFYATLCNKGSTKVAPHDGCVDWNEFNYSINILISVAPHDGCVDWNYFIFISLKYSIVAPHDGCVDWNIFQGLHLCIILESHPTMGAWIEIIFEPQRFIFWTASHPTMGAWIEIWS